MSRLFRVGLFSVSPSGLRWRLQMTTISRFSPLSSCALSTFVGNHPLEIRTRRQLLYYYSSPAYSIHPYFNSSPSLKFQIRFLATESSDKNPEAKSDEKKTTDVAKTTPSEVAEPKASLWRRFVNELKHYWHGTKLLGYEMRISAILIWRVLQGEDLTRRERNQLVKTAGDMFRLVPFIIIVIVPFAEFALPFLLKFFPNMLPTTFEEKVTREQKVRKQLKAKLEMAKFLQETLRDSAEIDAAKATGDHPTVHEFYKFLEKSRSGSVSPSIDEIVKFSQLFEDEMTLDRMSHTQLQAMCRVLGLTAIGTSQILRFQLRMKLRDLKLDDMVIDKEGVQSLNEEELQTACHARGMKSMGLPVERLREQLSEWLDLNLKRKVPASLLLFSRALYLPSDAQPEEQLSAAISQLPPAAAATAKVLLQEKTGSKVDPVAKLEMLKAEMAEIEKEKKEAEVAEAAEKKAKEKEAKGALPEPALAPMSAADKETLVDKAPVIGAKADKKKKEEGPPVQVSTEDVDTIESAIEALAQERHMNINAVHLKELHDDMSELLDLLNQKVSAKAKEKQKDDTLTQSRVNRYLTKRLNKILSRADQTATKLAKKPSQHEEYVVHIDELLATVKRLKNVTDEAKLKRIIAILDENGDGFISVNEVLKVIDLLDEENVDVMDKNLHEVMEMIKKEDRIAETIGEKKN